MINSDIVKEIQRASFQGKSKLEMKPLYIRQNAFNISLESIIYRIAQLPYLLDDIANSRITLSNIHPAVFDDALENPVLNKIFLDEGKDEITLNGIMKDYYGLSWTLEEKENIWWWNIYSRGNKGIRIETTAGKLMNEICTLSNPYFMLQYRIGKVSYHSKHDIESWINESHYTSFLDSLGQYSALSLMALNVEHEDEKEVRLLYTHMPNDLDNDFVKNNVSFDKTICKHPFNWNAVLQNIILDPSLSKNDFSEYEHKLRGLGITCNIKHSDLH